MPFWETHSCVCIWTKLTSYSRKFVRIAFTGTTTSQELTLLMRGKLTVEAATSPVVGLCTVGLKLLGTHGSFHPYSSSSTSPKMRLYGNSLCMIWTWTAKFPFGWKDYWSRLWDLRKKFEVSRARCWLWFQIATRPNSPKFVLWVRIRCSNSGGSGIGTKESRICLTLSERFWIVGSRNSRSSYLHLELTQRQPPRLNLECYNVLYTWLARPKGKKVWEVNDPYPSWKVHEARSISIPRLLTLHQMRQSAASSSPKKKTVDDIIIGKTIMLAWSSTRASHPSPSTSTGDKAF